MLAKSTTKTPVLTIAGSDCSGGAGIQADLKTFSAHDLFGMSAIVSIVAENTRRVISVHNLAKEVLAEQLEAIFEDIVPAATKVGMIGSLELMEGLKEGFIKYSMANVVIDPVMFAKNGAPLMDVANSAYFRDNLVAFSDVLTPNIPEAQYLCEHAIASIADMERAAKNLVARGAKSVLVKGGHGDSKKVVDVLYDGEVFSYFELERIETKNTHGTGCTLSSAIAANLAKGYDIKTSIARAKTYVHNAIYHSLSLGRGHGPTNHQYEGYLEDV